MAEDLTDTGTAIEGLSTPDPGKDLVYEAEVTTNRVDAMNHYGIAREVSAIYDLDLKPVAPKLRARSRCRISRSKSKTHRAARVIRRASSAASRSAPSPGHIVRRLELIDQRSICNVADATNYVLNELGHPTHAFDLDKLEGGKIVVRRAREGEVLKTLDGVERRLRKQDLVIADAVSSSGAGRHHGRL